MVAFVNTTIRMSPLEKPCFVLVLVEIVRVLLKMNRVNIIDNDRKNFPVPPTV